jgi:hypothetical protein
MKLFSLVLVIIASLALLVFTNPSMDDYSNFIRQSVLQETRKDKGDTLGQVFSPLFGSIAGSLVASQTLRNDYIFFSMYEAQFGKQRFKALGLLKRFVVLESPRSQ